MATGWLLAGCSTSSINPVNWWHRQESGKIAEDRPAPPGADQPYPNISTVPSKPAPPDADALKKLTDSLVADRTNAQHAAQSAPLADPSSPSASPTLFGVGTAPPPPPSSANLPAGSPTASGPTVASASLPAVTAPAAPSSAAASSFPPVPSPSAASPSAAPRKTVQSTPLDAPTTQDGSVQSGPTPGIPSQAPPSPTPSNARTTPSDGVTLAGPSPALPAGPPPRPGVAGPAPIAPVMPAPMPTPSARPSATIVFQERAANLSQPAAEEVKAFAAKRGTATVSVVGYGDSTASDPESQSAALNLGLSRAQAIVDALKAAGVPGNAIRVSAEASGRGAQLQLLQ